jgi:hypothetical protein
MPLIGRWIDVDVRKYMVHRHANPDAGNFGSPKEVPVLVDLQILVPANRLENIAIGNEAITNECTFGNVANAPILTAWNVKHST